MTYDFIVVGAGIAGIAIAELLQRSGQTTLLLESNNKFASGATAQQQGWFHTGALYAAFPDPIYFSACIKNISLLHNYYGGFKRLNFPIYTNELQSHKTCWFNNVPTYYLYVSDKSLKLNFVKRIYWKYCVNLAKKRLSSFYDRNNYCPTKNEKDYSFIKNIQSSLSILPSMDTTYNSKIIINDLLSSFTNNGGTFSLNTTAVNYTNKHLFTDNNKSFKSEKIIITSGYQLKFFTKKEHYFSIKKSPILVLNKHLSSANFIKMSPIIKDTINHVFHYNGGNCYSVIGNAMFFKHDAQIDNYHIKDIMLNKLEEFFPNLKNITSDIYFGYKVEDKRKNKIRNYMYSIINTNNDVIFAIPGKMSLAFSLAVETLNQLKININKSVKPLSGYNFLDIIDDPIHLKLFRKINEE